MSKTTYFAADTPFQAERERLSILERLFDARTKEFLTELGVAKGWQCCDVGAGGGSITRWLAQAVGPAGRVVAVDQNTRFLEDIELPNVNVLKQTFSLICILKVRSILFLPGYCSSILVIRRRQSGAW